VLTTTTQGLQQGKTLDQIKVYPQDIEAGNIISPDLFLKNSPFGITQISRSVIDSVIRASRGDPEAESQTDHIAIERMTKWPAVGSGMDCIRIAEIADWAGATRRLVPLTVRLSWERPSMQQRHTFKAGARRMRALLDESSKRPRDREHRKSREVGRRILATI